MLSSLNWARSKNPHNADAWCRALVHVYDALAVAILRGCLAPDVFRNPASAKLDPAEWRPVPVAAELAALIQSALHEGGPR
jgi:hypothetical protein